MFYMKKLVLFASSSLLLAACGQADQPASDTTQPADTSTSQPADTKKTDIVATTTQVADLIHQIGGDHVEVTQLMGPGVDPHGYQPSSSDTTAINDANVLAYNGFHLEAMFVPLFESLDQTDTHIISIENALSSDDVLASEEDDDALEYDPHIWFSIDNWKKAADYVTTELGDIDPSHADVYQSRNEAYQKSLDDLKSYVEERVEEIPESSRYLVTAHDAFQYFANEFGFEVVSVQGLNTNTEAGTGDISRLADFIAEHNIKSVFVESSVSSRNIDALIEAAASRGHTLEKGGELYSDALGDAEDGADTYIGMYKANIDTIVNALK